MRGDCSSYSKRGPSLCKFQEGCTSSQRLPMHFSARESEECQRTEPRKEAWWSRIVTLTHDRAFRVEAVSDGENDSDLHRPFSTWLVRRSRSKDTE